MKCKHYNIKEHVVGEQLQFFEATSSSELCVGPQYISYDPTYSFRNAEAYINQVHTMTAGLVALSVQRLATGWTVRRSNPGGGEIFRTCPDRLWGTHSLLYNGYRVFPGGKERPRRDADPSSSSSAVVMTG
jgi:hypothetical protein